MADLDKSTVANHAIRSALLSWGHAWTKLDVETRKAYLMLEIVRYLSGNAWNDHIPRQDKASWTARDCWDVLDTCVHWSTGGQCGANLAMFAEPEDDRFRQMFTDPYGFPYK